MLWVGKLILDALIRNHPNVWRLVGIEIALAAASDLLGRANALCDSLLGDRFTNRVSILLMRHAAALDLAAFEDPIFYDKLERARKQTTGRLGLLAGLLSVAQDSISLLSLSAGLIVFSPWLMVLLAAAVIPAFLGETHYSKARLLRALPAHAAAPPARLPTRSRRQRPERERSEDLRPRRIPH